MSSRTDLTNDQIAEFLATKVMGLGYARLISEENPEKRDWWWKGSQKVIRVQDYRPCENIAQAMEAADKTRYAYIISNINAGRRGKFARVMRPSISVKSDVVEFEAEDAESLARALCLAIIAAVERL